MFEETRIQIDAQKYYGIAGRGVLQTLFTGE